MKGVSHLRDSAADADRCCTCIARNENYMNEVTEMFSKVTEDIYYVGVNDHDIDLFEGQYDVPNGMAYNSYVVMDEKVTVFDTVDAHFKDEWLGNLAEVLGDRTPDYLIVQHMEPDHSANIAAFA